MSRGRPQSPAKPSTAIFSNAVKALKVVAEKAAKNRLAGMRWLPAQMALLTEPARVKMIRTGNQAHGKTTCALAELIYRCQGNHPWLDTRTPPITCWVICASWKQSVAIQRKLWELVPRDWVSPTMKFDPRHGFGQHAPILVFRNGSTIAFRTSKQDALDMAGSTIDVVLFDEPPRSRRIFEECKKRVMARNGVVVLSMTPVNAPIDWIKEEVEAGRIRDLHFRLEARHLIPVGESRPIKIEGRIRDQAWIDEQIADTAPYEVPVTIHGEWEMKSDGAVFKAWHPQPEAMGGHLSERLPSVPLQLSVGLDHGGGTGRQMGILVGVLQAPGEIYPHVYVLSESQSTGLTTVAQDAKDLLDCLATVGVAWSDLDHAYGDKPQSEGRLPKSNEEMELALVKELGRSNPACKTPRDLGCRISSAKRGRGAGRGSVDRGVSWLHRLMVDGRLHVHPRCVRLIECLSRWDYSDEYKDAVDALRYALTPWIRRSEGERKGSRVALG